VWLFCMEAILSLRRCVSSRSCAVRINYRLAEFGINAHNNLDATIKRHKLDPWLLTGTFQVSWELGSSRSPFFPHVDCVLRAPVIVPRRGSGTLLLGMAFYRLQ
jgi:hypothetical protein